MHPTHQEKPITILIFLLLVLLAVLPLRAQQDENPPAEAVSIAILPQDGFNLEVNEQITPTHAVLNITSPAHNWFAGTFTHLPIGQPVTFGISLAGKDTVELANVAKWQGLRPVMTYADPMQYECYVGYIKRTDGHWIADDLFRVGGANDAGTGPLPAQTIIPTDVAEQFLSPDGKCWYPWREIDPVQVLTNVNICRITTTFGRSSATLAMRVPYTYTYQQAFFQRLSAAKLPGVYLDEIGITPEGRTLTVIRLEPPDPTNAPKERPTILAYAREHATEPDGSWTIEGMLCWLLSADPDAQMARRQYDWLLVPMLDPDMAVRAVFTNANMFRNVPPVRPEAVAYATYLVNRVDAGHRLELVIDMHNIECAEGPQLFTPFIDAAEEATIRELNEPLWVAAQHAGFTTGPSWTMVGWATERLCGWCYMAFRTIDLMYEVNGRAPDARLSPIGLRAVGRLLAQHSAGILRSAPMSEKRVEMTRYLEARAVERAAWWKRQGRNARTRTTGDLLVSGY